MIGRKDYRWFISNTFILLLFSGIYLPGQLFAATCTEGVAEPPFLSYGKVDPNVLLMIDNSASMYDMAYLKDQTFCFDDNYTETLTYTGYFDSDTYYKYDLTTGNFEETSGIVEAYSICGSGNGTTYKTNTASYDDNYVCVNIDETLDPHALRAFAAKGNFLNWAASSKFDIEKKVLTGGKYDDNNTMIMENRGCANRRFIKQTGLDGGYYLTLGIRPPEESEMMDGSDNTTRIEVFPVTSTGFDMTACQNAVEEIQEESPVQGDFKNYVDDCMGYEEGGGNDPLDNRQATFNHSLHFCWYYAKHGEWPSGVGAVSSIQNDCELVYEDGGLPPTITPDNRSYVCYGIYDANKTHDERYGYVGRCWEPEIAPNGCTPVPCYDPDGDGNVTNDTDVEPQASVRPYHDPFCGEDDHVYYCDGSFNENKGTCGGNPGVFRMLMIEENEGDCDGNFTLAQWTDDNGDTGEICVDQALKDYCGMLEVPEVVDPSDQASQTDEFWNLPAVLIDSGVLAQIDEPILIMNGLIAADSPPSGLLQEISGELRLGAMTFNDDGAASECDDNIINCTSGLDGGQIIAEINDSNDTAHVDNLIESINDIKALSWTPLAEAMYNAIGYYGQDTSRRLNATDFNATSDPINYWCQNNNILILTEGASTTDLNLDLQNFIAIDGQNDADEDNATCSPLYGSSFLDDLAYYAQESNASSLYTVPQLNEEDKRNIKTYVVSSGSLRSTGSDECSPDILMENTAINGGTSLLSSEDPDELEYNLRRVFSEITNKASSGSAASVISSSRSGEGALYQAIFWPSKEPESESSDLDPIIWTGDVHALFVNEDGEIYEDTDGNRALADNDSRVVLYFDEAAQVTKACYDYHGGGNCTDSRPLHEIKFLWSAAEWLGNIEDGNIGVNRSPYISDVEKRYIFTWNDLDNDGIVFNNDGSADDEVLPFVEDTDWGNATHTVSSDRGEMIYDFGVSTSSEVNEIINWIRGADNETTMRSRQTVKYYPHTESTEEITWRLGDIVHSTPTAVSRPAEGFHFLYRDSSYAAFVKKYQDRRNVIYFGANDGMLHAINGGFYDGRKTKFCKTSDCENEDTAMDLGAELWAYVPYNLQPHLKCLTESDYDHKYYVDLKPRVFDARIFPDDGVNGTHPNGWGTLLVGGMRFGGAPVNADALNGGSDNRIFRSAYFFLDITDPESPPVLLGETTSTTSSTEVNLGYTIASPTIISMKTGADEQKWYLVMGTGPTTVKGESDQDARVVILPLNWLNELYSSDPAGSSNKTALRIPDKPPGMDTGAGESGSEGGTFPLLNSENSFISSLVAVDFELEENYKTDAVYFGTIEGNFTSGWEGGVYRLISREMSGGSQQTTTPSDWLDLSSTEVGGIDYLNPLIETDQPVTAPVAIGSDNNNYWIYFGTGRFYHGDDKTDNSTQFYYGIKEPRLSGTLTWETVEIESVLNWPNLNDPGDQGLIKVDQIEVTEITGELSCVNGTDTCLPPFDATRKVDDLNELNNFIEDYRDGWYRELTDERERNLGQATLLGGLLTFTSYQPYEELCRARGLSSLYGVYYQTGTAWYQHIFDVDDLSDDEEKVRAKIDLGMGLSLTPNLHVGRDKKGPTAMVQTSTGEIQEISQQTQPLNNFQSGRASWKQVND